MGSGQVSRKIPEWAASTAFWADGPAFFAMTIAAVPALAFALWLQISFGPPFWVHVLTTLPATLVACALLLRPLKGWLVCSQFFHKAEEGSIDREWHERRRAEEERRKS
ncbi:DUF983 domain-containing protein [Mesorhizobium sediminum]|nr:DUF983 domain-containing protein [Mesorhizobium sediminum]